MKTGNEIPELNIADAMAVVAEEKTEMDKVLDILLDPKNIEHLTELSQNEITAFSVLDTVALKYPLPVLTDFLKVNKKLRVSKKRLGRKEIGKIVSRQLTLESQMMQEQNGGVRRFFNRPKRDGAR